MMMYLKSSRMLLINELREKNFSSQCSMNFNFLVMVSLTDLFVPVLLDMSWHHINYSWVIFLPLVYSVLLIIKFLHLWYYFPCYNVDVLPIVNYLVFKLISKSFKYSLWEHVFYALVENVCVCYKPCDVLQY